MSEGARQSPRGDSTPSLVSNVNPKQTQDPGDMIPATMVNLTAEHQM
jgi:hypothetical protein